MYNGINSSRRTKAPFELGGNHAHDHSRRGTRGTVAGGGERPCPSRSRNPGRKQCRCRCAIRGASWFSEALEPRFSKAELRSTNGAVVATGGADPADRKALVVPVSGLKPGKYKVIWKVISTDTHRSEGDFSFEIKP